MPVTAKTKSSSDAANLHFVTVKLLPIYVAVNSRTVLAKCTFAELRNMHFAGATLELWYGQPMINQKKKKKKSETELTASILKKDSKHTRD